MKETIDPAKTQDELSFQAVLGESVLDNIRNNVKPRFLTVNKEQDCAKFKGATGFLISDSLAKAIAEHRATGCLVKRFETPIFIDT